MDRPEGSFCEDNLNVVFDDDGVWGEDTPGDGSVHNPLHMACGERRTDDVRALLAAGVDVNAKCCGAPAIVIACKYGGIEIVDLLLRGGTDPRSRSRTGRSLLQVAAFGSDAGLARFLLANGVPLDGGFGSSPLAMATAYRDVALVGALRDAGADPYDPQCVPALAHDPHQQ